MPENDRDMMSDQLVFMEALYAIAHESSEADVVRIALAALVNTSGGLQYLSAHPLTV